LFHWNDWADRLFEETRPQPEKKKVEWRLKNNGFIGISYSESGSICFIAFFPVLIADYIYNLKKRKSTIKFPALGIAKKASSTYRVKFRHVVPALRFLALICFIVALARPQKGVEVEYIHQLMAWISC
jgi:hypothetical protein